MTTTSKKTSYVVAALCFAWCFTAKAQSPDLTAEVRVDSVSPVRLTLRITNTTRKKITLYYADDHEYQLRFQFTDAGSECFATPINHEPAHIKIGKKKTVERSFECTRFIRHGSPRHTLPPGTYRTTIYYEYNGNQPGMWRGTFYTPPAFTRIEPIEADLSQPALDSIPVESGGAKLTIHQLASKVVAQGVERSPDEPTPMNYYVAASLEVTAEEAFAYDDWALYLEDASGALEQAEGPTTRVGEELWFGEIPKGKTTVEIRTSRFRPMPLKADGTYRLVVRLRRGSEVVWLRTKPQAVEQIPLTPEEMMVP